MLPIYRIEQPCYSVGVKHEDLKKYWEEEERLQGPQPPLLPAPTAEELAEFLELMRRMDGHPSARFLMRMIEVERVIAWEERDTADVFSLDVEQTELVSHDGSIRSGEEAAT